MAGPAGTVCAITGVLQISRSGAKCVRPHDTPLSVMPSTSSSLTPREVPRSVISVAVVTTAVLGCTLVTTGAGVVGAAVGA
jgi:hypothetical protein